VPLIFAGPGIPAARQRAQFCYLHDVFPTLCDLVDCPIPSSVEGQSLKHALAQGTSGGRRFLYHAYRDVQRAVRDGRFKLIEYVTGTERHTQLFDLAADPAERVNLAELPDKADTVRALRAHLMALRQECGDSRELEQGFWENFGGATQAPRRAGL
jgi:arylsulfatase A-like enzyme